MSEDLNHKLYSSTDCIPEQTMFDYIDNKLSPKEQHAVEKHMLDCGLCADAMEGLRMVKDRSRIAAIHQRVSVLMAAPAEKKVVKINYYRITASIAAGIALLIGSMLVFNFLITNKEQDVAEMKELKNTNEDSFSKNKAAETESAPLHEEMPPPPPAAAIPVTRDHAAALSENERAEEKVSQELNVHAARKPNAPDNIALEGKGAIAAGSTTTITTADQQNIQADYAVKDEVQEDSSFREFAKDRNDSKSKTAENSSGKFYEKTTEESIVMKSLSKDAIEQTQLKKEEKNSKTDLEQKVPALGETESIAAYAPGEFAISANRNVIKADSVSVKQNAPGYYNVTLVDQPAQFPGGETEMLKFIQKNFNYGSANYKEQDIKSNKIFVEFVVTKTGEIRDVKVKKGINPLLDKEAIRVIKSMPRWTAAKKDGKAVDMIMVFPIKLEFK